MGYQVYEANGRWQGYGVPAYCDYPGCKEQIDRGMGYQSPEDAERGSGTPEVFVCNNHKYQELDSFIVEEKEHPDWITHIQTDDTWKEWRDDNPEELNRLTALVD